MPFIEPTIDEDDDEAYLPLLVETEPEWTGDSDDE
jgi:hypothetical protein